MAEFCLDCWNKISGKNYPASKYIISENLDLCEECGKITNVIIMERKAYYLRKFRFIIFPFKTVYILVKGIIILPYNIYRITKHNKNKKL